MCAKSHTAALEAGASAAFGLLGFSSRRGWAQFKVLGCGSNMAGGFAVSIGGAFFACVSLIQRFFDVVTSNEPNTSLAALTSKQDQTEYPSNLISSRDGKKSRLRIVLSYRPAHQLVPIW